MNWKKFAAGFFLIIAGFVGVFSFGVGLSYAVYKFGPEWVFPIIMLALATFTGFMNGMEDKDDTTEEGDD